MRGSQRSSEVRTSYLMRPAVVASAGAKTYSWMPHPNSGRIGRSPWAVPRMSWIASSSSRSRATRAMPPLASTLRGKASPLPMKDSAISAQRDLGAGDRHAGRPLDGGLGLARHGDVLALDGHVLARLQRQRALLGLDGDVLAPDDLDGPVARHR